MLGEILSQGFALANRRPGLLLADILWKAIWLAATLALLLIVSMWFGSQLQSVAWQSTGIPALDSLLAATLFRQFWNAHKWELYWALATAIVASAVIWFLFEGAFRSRILKNLSIEYVVAGFSPRSGMESGRGLKPATTYSTGVFVVSNAMKFAALTAAATVLAVISLGQYLTTPPGQWDALWLDTRGAMIASLVAFTALAFLLTVFDTLIRSGATVLIGTDLIRVTGVVGILMLFEVMIAASVAIVVITGFLKVARMTDAIAMLGLAGLALVFLNVVHSYLLIVRFSAVDIMRRNVIEI